MAVVVLTGSTRRGRMSPRVAAMVAAALDQRGTVSVERLDLADFDIPFLRERLKYLSDPSADLVRFAEQIEKAAVLVVVSPEYNGACPGVLKNALDHLNDQYEKLPVAIVTVSAGPHGGDKCFEGLHTLFSRVGATVLEARLKVNVVQESVDQDGRDVAGRYREPLAVLCEVVEGAAAAGRH